MRSGNPLKNRRSPWGRPVCIALVFALSTGCALPGEMDTSSVSADITAPGTTMPTDPWIDGLTEGMAYADLRAQVHAAGWRPKIEADCRTNVLGANIESACAATPDVCSICDDLPELDACSADGHCLMRFERGGHLLTVSTYGELTDWNVAGTASRLLVKWWDPDQSGPLHGDP